MAKARNKPNTVARIVLTTARALLGKHYLDHDGWVKLVHGLAAGDVPYWPNDSDLAALWRKLSGQDNNQQIQHVRFEGDWVEFYIKGVRRTVGPIQVGHKAVVALLPAEARVPQPGTTRRTQPKRKLAERALSELYPGGLPDSVSTETARASVETWCKMPISWATVARAAGRR